jgi:hypothetical protein
MSMLNNFKVIAAGITGNLGRYECQRSLNTVRDRYVKHWEKGAPFSDTPNFLVSAFLASTSLAFLCSLIPRPGVKPTIKQTLEYIKYVFSGEARLANKNKT